jgi:hypothetical protein
MKLVRLAKPGVLLLLLLLILSACGDSPDDDTIPPNGGDPVIGSITLIASSPQLPSSGQEPVTLTAFVRNTSNVLMEEIDVNFAANNDGLLQIIRDTTDASGSAQALLSTPSNPSNREITVTAQAGTISQTIMVQVTGTTLAVSGPTSAMLNANAELLVTLRDSAGIGIANTPLSITSAAANPISPAAAVTGPDGRTTITITIHNPAAGGTDTITINGAGSTTSHNLTIATDILTFIAPVTATEVPIGEPQAITVEWLSSGNPIADAPVELATTRGNWVENGDDQPTISRTTDADGRVTANILANNAGPATITATTTEGLAIKLEILFVATTAASVTLQANPAIIGTGEPSEILAVVRDSANNLVKNKRVDFVIDADVTIGNVSPSPVITDMFGRASTTYTAGPVSSGLDEVIIRATVAADGVNGSTSLSVAQKSLFISLGTGNQLEVLDEMRYSLPYGVMVTDSAGLPVANANVTLSIWPTRYRKGFYERVEETWMRVLTLPDPPNDTCPNEDVNRNGILDPGEDLNNNNQLDPGAVATINNDSDTVYTVTTDANGFATFNIVYFKGYATWADIELTARTEVAGTESTKKASLTLPILITDIQGDESPPGNPSPFGTTADCFGW